MTPARFPHSDTPGSTLGCQLPRAYRRLLRPSSALDAKASTTCRSQLVTHNTTQNQTLHTAKTLPTQQQQQQRVTRHKRTTPPATITPRMHTPAAHPTPDTHTHARAHGCRASHQMLASTIQISNNNPTTPPHRAGGGARGGAEAQAVA